MEENELRKQYREKKDELDQLKKEAKLIGKSVSLSNHIKHLKQEVKKISSSLKILPKIIEIEGKLSEFNDHRKEFSNYTVELKQYDKILDKAIQLKEDGREKESYSKFTEAVEVCGKIKLLKSKGKSGGREIYTSKNTYRSRDDPVICLSVIVFTFLVIISGLYNYPIHVALIAITLGIVLITIRAKQFKKKYEKQ